MTGILDNGDVAFTKFVEGLISNGQPFLGELLESEGRIYFLSERTSEMSKMYVDRKMSSTTADSLERVVIDDEMLKKCPGIDRLRADTREKLKTYLHEQVDHFSLKNFFISLNNLVIKSTSERDMESSDSE